MTSVFPEDLRLLQTEDALNHFRRVVVTFVFLPLWVPLATVRSCALHHRSSQSFEPLHQAIETIKR